MRGGEGVGSVGVSVRSGVGAVCVRVCVLGWDGVSGGGHI